MIIMKIKTGNTFKVSFELVRSQYYVPDRRARAGTVCTIKDGEGAGSADRQPVLDEEKDAW